MYRLERSQCLINEVLARCQGFDDVLLDDTRTYLAVIIGKMLSTNHSVKVRLHQFLDNC